MATSHQPKSFEPEDMYLKTIYLLRKDDKGVRAVDST